MLRNRPFPAIGLLLLSMLWAGGWLITDLFPSFSETFLSLPGRQAVVFSAFAALTASIAVMLRLEFPSGRRAWAGAAVGLGFFVIPTAAAAFAKGWISNFDQIAVLCLTPVFTIVLEPYLDENPRRGRAALAAALIAVAGVLCLFPLEVPSSFRPGAALLGLLVAAFVLAITNCAAVRLARSLPGPSTLPIAAQASGTAAVCFAAATAFTSNTNWHSSAVHVFLLRSLLIDIPSLALLFWLISRLGASRMSARFLLAPLFASLAGLALEQMLPPLRSLLGIVLLTAGSGWLAFAPAETTAEELDPLKEIAAPAPDPSRGEFPQR